MNKAIIIGNLTKDVELRNTPAGKQVATCSIATNKTYKDQQGQKQTVVQYHNLVIWGNPAGVFTQYLRKGSKVAIVGELQTRMWEKDGVKRYTTEIVVNEFEFLTPSQNNGQGGQGYAQPAPDNNFEQPGHDDGEEINVENIPF
jgi:single-strand DNA-binding protein